MAGLEKLTDSTKQGGVGPGEGAVVPQRLGVVEALRSSGELRLS
jgi:hypothetical protein